jgi:hypothetical protein
MATPKETDVSDAEEATKPAPRRRAPAKRAKAATRARSVTSKKKPAAKKATTKRSTRAVRPTLASVSAQLSVLSEQVAMILELVRSRNATHDVGSPEAKVNGAPNVPLNVEAFESDLLTVVAQIDRSNRHAGMVPIPEVRDAFFERGWTRKAFDERLLQAERDFVVDLKTANDPSILPRPDLAIEELGRGHLQYVVLR